jgi:hypothetical protein
LGEAVIVKAIEEANHAVLPRILEMSSSILRATDSAHRFPPSPQNEKFGLAALEEYTPLWIDGLSPVR